MRCPFVPLCPGFRNSYLGLGIVHLSFLGLGKGTDPLYAVLRSSYALYYIDVECYMLQLHRWARFVSETRQFQESAEVLHNLEWVSNF